MFHLRWFNPFNADIQICTYPCLGGAATQEVLVVDKPGDGEGSTWLLFRLGRHKPSLKETEQIFPLQNQRVSFFCKIIVVRNESYCFALKHVQYIFPLISQLMEDLGGGL